MVSVTEYSVEFFILFNPNRYPRDILGVFQLCQCHVRLHHPEGPGDCQHHPYPRVPRRQEADYENAQDGDDVKVKVSKSSTVLQVVQVYSELLYTNPLQVGI